MPTPSVENYLKAIFHLQGQEHRRVTTKGLADRLELSLPSVTNMLKSLAQEGLVDYRPYKGARLTSSGEAAALRVIRKHRLVEVFLVNALGFAWDEVHAEAERLEHAMSDKLADRIDAYLGYPRFDPHGDPIPTADGQLEQRDLRPLSAVDAGTTVHVARVLDQAPDVLRYLDELGLKPDVTIHVTGVLPFDGPLQVALGDRSCTIGRGLAARILVTPVAAVST